jgi:protein TonB
MPIVWTAHAIFKAAYNRTVRRALAAALVIHALIFIFGPVEQVKPPRLPEPQPAVLVDVTEITHVREEWPRIEEVDNPCPTPLPPPDPPRREPPIPAPVPLRGQLDVVGRLETAASSFLYHDREPVPVNLVRPRYPLLAREAGIEGRVDVMVLVDEKGRVANARVVNSDVTPAMERAALEAARQSVFEPALQGTRPVRARMVVPFHYRLR